MAILQLNNNNTTKLNNYNLHTGISGGKAFCHLLLLSWYIASIMTKVWYYINTCAYIYVNNL